MKVEIGPVLQQQRHVVAAAVAGFAIEGAERRDPFVRRAVADLDAVRMIGPARHGRGAEAAAFRHAPGRRLEQVEHRRCHRRSVC